MLIVKATAFRDTFECATGWLVEHTWHSLTTFALLAFARFAERDTDRRSRKGVGEPNCRKLTAEIPLLALANLPQITRTERITGADVNSPKSQGSSTNSPCKDLVVFSQIRPTSHCRKNCGGRSTAFANCRTSSVINIKPPATPKGMGWVGDHCSHVSDFQNRPRQGGHRCSSIVCNENDFDVEGGRRSFFSRTSHPVRFTDGRAVAERFFLAMVSTRPLPLLGVASGIPVHAEPHSTVA